MSYPGQQYNNNNNNNHNYYNHHQQQPQQSQYYNPQPQYTSPPPPQQQQQQQYQYPYPHQQQYYQYSPAPPPPPQQQQQQPYYHHHQSTSRDNALGGLTASGTSAPPPPPPAPTFQIHRRKALLIGINYHGQKGELRGCINDVRNVRNLLTGSYGFQDIIALTDERGQNPDFLPTRINMINAMRWLVGGAVAGDSLVFHYSGHGGQTEDKDGDEEDGFDETIYPLDHTSSGHIVDDEMHAIMLAHLPPGVRFTAVFDSCHSATALDLPYTYLPDGRLKSGGLKKAAGSTLQSTAMGFMRGGQIGAGMALFSGLKSMMNASGAKKRTESTRTTHSHAIMLAGCKDAQTSADTQIAGSATGAMSYALIKALSFNPHPTYGQLLAAVREILKNEYSQIPQFSAGHPVDMNTVFVL